MDSLAAQIIVNILNKEMQMPKNSVWLRDQNRDIPTDLGLYIVVGLVNMPSVMSNVCYMEEEIKIVEGEPVTYYHQINQLQTQEIIQIDILSRSNEALLRNMEPIMAMQSFYSQQMQELNNFKIFRNPRSFANTSSAEGSSQLNRYSITLAAMVWYRKDTLLKSPLGDYYDDFTQRVDDAKTIGQPEGLIEFEINKEGIIP